MSPENYTFKGFEISENPNKKYDAILIHQKTKKVKRVSFGARDYQHFKDKTGLGLYSHLDHNDPERRRLYKNRHGAEGYQKIKYRTYKIRQIGC